jgi:pimeloyl-ACP methyl ester carboxylesterase
MKPRTLIVHVDNDQWLISDKARAAAQAIPGAQYATLSSPIAHYAVFSALNTLADDPMLNTFERDIGIIEDKTKVCDAANYRSARVNMKPDPAKSFWKDEMVSPFPVKYAKVKDRRGVEWEIGYIDEYCGKDKNPPVLVVVHGKGAVRRALRLPDQVRGRARLPRDRARHAAVGHVGPGNLDKPMTRTLDDVRDAFHALIVGKLGVKKAFYHGHSLGGATVLGYTLRYPDAVRGPDPRGPAGLEEYPRNVKLGDKEMALCDKSFAYDRKRWEESYGRPGCWKAKASAPSKGVRDFFYFKQRDPKTDASRPATTATSRSTPSTRGCTPTSASR